VRITALLLALPCVLTAQDHTILKELVADALLRNPEILAAQKKYEAARQRPAQERALPDPMVSAGWTSAGNPLPGAGVGSNPVANAGVMASQELPAPGKLRLRGEVAAKEADVEMQQFRAVEFDVIARLKIAYFGLDHAWLMQDVLESNREVLRSLLHVTEARYSVGKGAQADVFKAQTQITLIETRLVQFERERHAREAEINSLLDRPGSAALPRPPEPHFEPLNFSAEDLIEQARQRSPELMRDQKRIEASSLALNLARKDYSPDVTLNAGYYNMGSMPSMYMFRADVRIPIHTARTRAEITERSQEMAGAKHAYEATSKTLEYQIRDEFLAAQTAQKLIDLYTKVLIPQARLTVESSLASYQTGSTDFLSVLTNELAITDYEMNYHEQLHEFHTALVLLEQMSGAELIP